MARVLVAHCLIVTLLVCGCANRPEVQGEPDRQLSQELAQALTSPTAEQRPDAAQGAAGSGLSSPWWHEHHVARGFLLVGLVAGVALIGLLVVGSQIQVH